MVGVSHRHLQHRLFVHLACFELPGRLSRGKQRSFWKGSPLIHFWSYRFLFSSFTREFFMLLIILRRSMGTTSWSLSLYCLNYYITVATKGWYGTITSNPNIPKQSSPWKRGKFDRSFWWASCRLLSAWTSLLFLRWTGYSPVLFCCGWEKCILRMDGCSCSRGSWVGEQWTFRYGMVVEVSKTPSHSGFRSLQAKSTIYYVDCVVRQLTWDSLLKAWKGFAGWDMEDGRGYFLNLSSVLLLKFSPSTH